MNPVSSAPWYARGTVVFSLIIVGLLALGSPIIIGNLWENLDAHEIMVVQAPTSGELTVHTDPGIKWQGFGKVTKYPRRAQYEFDTAGSSKKIRFNDGGHADLFGAVSWEMPLSGKEVIAIHKTFGSYQGVEQAAIGKMIDASVYLAGPLMSSTESSGERRAELVQYINDQAENGVYVTSVKEKEIIDPITNTKKAVTVTVIERNEKGMPRRQQGSILADFNIKLLPMSIKELKYDSVVEDQIKQRQSATTQVQIAQANARRAEQDALTTAKQGEANAAKAKWEQETIKAKMVTEAQQKLEVATLSAKEAAQWKAEQILRGEGEAARKRLVMAADGALQPKLDIMLEVNKVWADAYARNTTQQVPTVVMGGYGGGKGDTAMSNVQSLMQTVGAKAAYDFAVDLGVGGKNATGGRSH